MTRRPHRYGPRTSRWILSVLLLTISASAFAIVEAVTRHRHPEATREAIVARIEGERNAWRRPDGRFHHVGDDIFKLRFAGGPEAAPRRIMIVGDSFTMGHGVGIQHRFGTLLAQRLDGRREVDVLATSSYSPIIYRNIVRQALSSADYSVAAVFVDQTDPADDFIYRNDLLGEDAHEFNVPLMSDRNAETDRAYERMTQALSGWKGLARRSAVLNVLSPLSLAARFPEDSEHYRYIRLALDRGLLLHAFENLPEIEATLTMESLLFAHLDEVVELCRVREVPLILAANPWEYQVSELPRVGRSYIGPFPRENRLERLLIARYGDLAGVSVMELTQVFRDHPDASSLFLDRPSNEIHWNREGHALVGRALEERLREHVPQELPSGTGDALAEGHSTRAVGPGERD